MSTALGPAAGDLPPAPAWRAAAARHADLFASLDDGARVALLARAAPQAMLVWETGSGGVDARLEPFAGYAACGADIVLAADDAALDAIGAALDGALFDTLRAGIRAGHVVCYVLQRRCTLEARGFEEMLDALGYAFMGACR